MIKYFDAHCHLQFDAFYDDQAELLEKMRAEGVAGIVVGIDEESSAKALALAERHDHLYAAAGLHPNYLGERTFRPEHFAKLLVHPKCVAVGECGLDYYRPKEVTEEVKQAQQEALKQHFDLAAGADKPLIIHARPTAGTQDAYHDLIGLLKAAKTKYPHLRGDIHFFVGGREEAAELFKLDFTVSYTAVITFARDYDDAIRSAPLDRLLSETDSPYVAPAPRRRERNDPLSVRDVVAKIAEIRGEDPEVVRAALLENAQRLFGLSTA